MRRPFQGVGNIVRFNWHFYVLSLVFILTMLLLANYLGKEQQLYSYILCSIITGTVLISLLVSYYVYDLSGLYKFNWLKEFIEDENNAVNINAGFDETSQLLKEKFYPRELIVFDFYEPEKHTEVSIKRARKAYPPFPNTIQVATSRLPLSEKSVDNLFVIFSAHEIRDTNERIAFFKELSRVIKPTGQIVIIEHIRDFSNFMAYNIGFLHFYSRSTWLKTFQSAQLKLQNEIKFTPFISTFLLKSNGDTF